MCSIDDFVHGKYEGPPIGSSLDIIHQIGLGIEQLHKLKIVHSNLKPSNVLISKHSGTVLPKIKLTDFGLRFLEPLNVVCSKADGWLPFDLELTAASDIFTYGCLITFILTFGFHPYGKENLKRIVRVMDKEPMVLTKDHLKDLDNASQVVVLIQSMVNPEASERPTIIEVLKNSILQSPNNKRKSPNQHSNIFYLYLLIIDCIINSLSLKQWHQQRKKLKKK